MNLLTYQINAKVLMANGGSISTGAISVFTPYSNDLSGNKLPIDINFWYSPEAKEKNWQKVLVCTDEERKIIFENNYMPITDPDTQLDIKYVTQYGLELLEGIYGAGNITILK